MPPFVPTDLAPETDVFRQLGNTGRLSEICTQGLNYLLGSARTHMAIGAVSLAGVTLAQVEEVSPRMKAVGVSVWLAGALAAGWILAS